MEDSERIAKLESEVETLLGVTAGLTAIVGALMQTSSRYTDMQLAATASIELMVAKAPSLGPKGREQAQRIVETLQQLLPIPPGSVQHALNAAAMRGGGGKPRAG